MDKSRWKNYGLWVSLISLFGLVLNNFGLLPANYSDMATGILSVLVTLGIVNNPTTENQGYLDDIYR